MNHNESRKINSTLITSFVAFGLFIISLIVNFFREELFGFQSGIAGHNFSFNISFFIPINFIAIILCLYVLTKIFILREFKADKKNKIICLSLTLPIVILWSLHLLRIIMLL